MPRRPTDICNIYKTQGHNDCMALELSKNNQSLTKKSQPLESVLYPFLLQFACLATIDWSRLMSRASDHLMVLEIEFKLVSMVSRALYLNAEGYLCCLPKVWMACLSQVDETPIGNSQLYSGHLQNLVFIDSEQSSCTELAQRAINPKHWPSPAVPVWPFLRWWPGFIGWLWCSLPVKIGWHVRNYFHGCLAKTLKSSLEAHCFLGQNLCAFEIVFAWQVYQNDVDDLFASESAMKTCQVFVWDHAWLQIKSCRLKK